jgi:hypothetical protein
MGIASRAKAIDALTRSHYFPGTDKVRVKLVVEEETGRLLGGQIVGGAGAAKRIDTIATAITARMTAQQLAYLDLAYAPPFSPVWDPVQTAARTLAAGSLRAAAETGRPAARGAPTACRPQGRPQRPLPLRLGKEIQEMLRGDRYPALTAESTRRHARRSRTGKNRCAKPGSAPPEGLVHCGPASSGIPAAATVPRPG